MRALDREGRGTVEALRSVLEGMGRQDMLKELNLAEIGVSVCLCVCLRLCACMHEKATQVGRVRDIETGTDVQAEQDMHKRMVG